MPSYVAITPTRNEAENLRRLAACMLEQTQPVSQWIIVDNGSTDATVAIANELAEKHPWITLLEVPGMPNPTRGAPVVRAFHAGVDALTERADVVVKLDADVSFGPDHFARLLDAFEREAMLGIGGGTSLERQRDGSWRPDRLTGDHVRGSVRAYRWECLHEVMPLEAHMGWDGIDEMKAQVRGWETRTLKGLVYYHHRVMGAREHKCVKWFREGDLAHFMGYRASYLLVRTVYHTFHELSAVAMVAGFVTAAVKQQPRCSEKAAILELQRQQSLLMLPSRIREKLGVGTA